jgi:hypothetical protein
MTSFTFSLEQLRSAPPEVRRWIENEIVAALGSLTRSEHGPSEPHSAELAACTPEEALRVSELIKGNFLLSQVFFELAREMPPLTGGPGPCHILNIGEIFRHTRLADEDRLADCDPENFDVNACAVGHDDLRMQVIGVDLPDQGGNPVFHVGDDRVITERRTFR